MSHLSLDARAILEYLNELGYRNISAEQLKEFLKGMQPHSEISKSKHKAKSSSNQQPPSSQQQQQQQQQEQLPATTTAAAAAEATTKPQRRPHLKVIKSKKPLQNYKFYLDICDHQLTKRIEELIKQLGGTLEFFLTASVTHFITDKTVLPPTVANNNNNNNNNNNTKLSSSRPGTPQTPATPGTPKTPYSLEQQNVGGSSKQPTAPRTIQTRADAILSRARRQSTTSNAPTTFTATPTTELAVTLKQPTATTFESTSTTSPYIVWQTEQALRFFTKIQNELREYISPTEQHHKLNGKSYGACKPINLKESFIKIESLKRNFRPYYHLFRKPAEWPKIELTRDDGAFRLSPKKTHAEAEEAVDKHEQEQKMTRKSRSRSSTRQQQPASVQALKKVEAGAKATSAVAAAGQRSVNAGGNGACKQVKETSEKQCGVCEICKIEYDTLTIHLKTKDHEYFAKNSQNFIALDTLIHNSADVNKFLNDTNKLELKTEELEEMEVEEELSVVDVNTPDPLEDPLVCLTTANATTTATCEDKRRSSGAHNTPSPTIREKSKRSTKGKHSSEKFQRASTTPKQTASNAKSPKTPPKPSTAAAATFQQKKQPTQLTSTNLMERIDATAAVPTSSAVSIKIPPATRRKPSALLDNSPPMRAMLPPSSLYKVVETPEQLATSTRKTGRDAGAVAGDVAVGSPSLIVKFKKVRQTELHRLNGEAENFMFPKRRNSSDEQPTDVDRQTTSDNMRVSVSSISLDSTSENMDVEVENMSDRASLLYNNNSARSAPAQAKKAIATAKRRKGQKAPLATSTAAAVSKQSFPSAPIQPEVQLKRYRKSASTTAATVAASALAAASASITLPEATRKSSRTATAIVTAATTSSRLLRAAVEAAKHNRRRLAAANEASVSVSASVSTTLPMSKRKCSSLPIAMPATVRANVRGRSRGVSVVKMEDRMGESESNTDESDNHEEDVEDIENAQRNNVEDEDDDDDDDDDDEEQDVDSDDEQDDNDDDYKDADYKGTYKQSKSARGQATTSNRAKRVSTREQRAALRQSRISDEEQDDTEEENETDDDDVDEEEEQHVPAPAPLVNKEKEKVIEPKCAKPKPQLPPHPLFYQQHSPHKKSSPQRAFDHTKSERLDKLRYAFERLPAADLWYRVFSRQDTCEERYFEYFGSTKYRKLPYELGPIPFDSTLSGVCCNLCTKAGVAQPPVAVKTANGKAKKVKQEYSGSSHPINIKQEQETSNAEALSLSLNTTNGDGRLGGSPTPSGNAQSATSSQYLHKHKKLHLLQRYRQEQRELMQKQQREEDETHERKSKIASEVTATANSNTTTTTPATAMKCDSKASTPERERDRERNRERAGSTHSTVSSCASSSATLSKKPYRNKHLNKAAFLNLELPPRKSPREHASTLALVSCINKQRQDSQSKPNSDTDEPPTTPTPQQHETKSCFNYGIAEKSSIETTIEDATTASVAAAAAATVASAIRSPRATRSAAATPIEELRFATEISENVKRLRRGQNKYDHSPPLVLNATRRASRGRPPMSATQSAMGRRSHLQSRRALTPTTTQKRRKRKSTAVGAARHQHSYGAGATTSTAAAGSIRKMGTKKGVLEFEMDASALKALETSRQHTNVRQLEWEIDKYLQLAGKNNDDDLCDLEFRLGGCAAAGDAVIPTETGNESSTNPNASTSNSNLATPRAKETKKPKTLSAIGGDLNTPPPTDCFSSDFDLYDMFACTNAGADADEQATEGKQKGFSVYSSVALHNYFRKRKSLKSNRTGWPKVQKKKSSARQQHKLAEKIRFLEGIGEANGGIAKQPVQPLNDAEQDKVATNNVDGNSKRESGGGGGGVITPPDSEMDEDEEDAKRAAASVDDEAAEETEHDVAESIEDEDDDDEEVDEEEEDDEDDVDTVANSIDEAVRVAEADVAADADVEEEEDEAAGDATEADDAEEADNDDDEEDEDEDEEVYVHESKRARLRSFAASPADKPTSHNNLTPNTAAAATTTAASTASAAATSTPSTQMLRGLRRTPQLNGSLGSCISPSEKAGDNSDIFTVSSDGLDTDLDMSNSHSQHKGGNDDDHCANHTPKRKFDLGKYVSSNAAAAAASSSCAAEAAATAAVKSLAISQFLKKEVRVTCRRLRAPFRRFRYRR